MRVAIVLIVFAVIETVASWVGGLLVPSRFFFLHNLVGDLVSIAVVPIPIIGIVLLYQDITRSRFDAARASAAAVGEGPVAPGP